METHAKSYLSAKKYVQAALELLAAGCPEGPPEPTFTQEHVRSSEKIFLLRAVEFPYWQRMVWSHPQARHALPEYEPFMRAMRSDPTFARYFNVLVGTNRGGTTFSPEDLADQLIWRMAEACGRLAFDSTLFDRLFKIFDAEIREDEIEFVAVAPIQGFKSESLPIPLAKNLEIDHLTDEEIGRCLGLGIPMGLDSGGMVYLNTECGVRYRFSEPKVFGQGKHDPKGMQLAHNSMTSEFLSVSHGLRLFKRGRTSIPAFVLFSIHWPVNNFTSSGIIEPNAQRASMYQLSATGAGTFAEFWHRAADGRKTAFLDAALRRFGFAGERHRPEDRLVDLMICAESLFLSDVGETKERGEMRFRLSLRFALFAEIEGFTRIDCFNLIKAAYDARSAIVHGGNPDERDLKLPVTGRVSLLQFVDAVEDALRGALHKAIATAPFKSNKLVDWERLSLGMP
jgi:hypothetical protein